jgi:hydrogenase/urease accessory protein HupE
LDLLAVALVGMAVAAADPSLAQAVLGEAVPRNVWQGLQSGAGNVVAGLVHLAAVIAVGGLAATNPKASDSGTMLVLVYGAACVLGASAHIGERTVADAPVLAALAVVAFGLLIFRKQALRRDILFALFAGGGLINGYVMGTTIAAAQRDAILGYLAGLAAIEIALALAVLYGLRLAAARPFLQLLAMRVIGAFAIGAGAAVLLQRYAGA